MMQEISGSRFDLYVLFYGQDGSINCGNRPCAGGQRSKVPECCPFPGHRLAIRANPSCQSPLPGQTSSQVPHQYNCNQADGVLGIEQNCCGAAGCPRILAPSIGRSDEPEFRKYLQLPKVHSNCNVIHQSNEDPVIITPGLSLRSSFH
jgi:hypothetical protein